MRDPDGRPTKRDPTFLAETQMMQKQAVDRIMPDQARQVRGEGGLRRWRGAAAAAAALRPALGTCRARHMAVRDGTAQGSEAKRNTAPM